MAACGENKPDIVSSASASSSADKSHLGGGKLAKAVRAAESASLATSAKAGQQPPPNGVFPAGDADKALAPGAPGKIDVMDDGAEPRVMLRRKPPTDDLKLPLAVNLSMGGRAVLPAFRVNLVIGPEKAKSDDKSDGKDPKKPKPASSAVASASAAPPVSMPPLTIAGPRISALIDDMHIEGNDEALPKELAAFKGSTVSFTMTDTGPVEFRHVLSPGAEPKLDFVLRAVEECLSELYIAAPDKPIGEGGFYIVADRQTSLGVDVLRYRVFKVIKINGDSALVSLDEKQYAAQPRIDLPQLGDQLAKLAFSKYTGASQGFLEIVPNDLYSKGAILGVQVQIGLAGADDKGGRGATLPIEIRAQLGSLPQGVSVQQSPDEEPQQ